MPPACSQAPKEGTVARSVTALGPAGAELDGLPDTTVWLRLGPLSLLSWVGSGGEQPPVSPARPQTGCDLGVFRDLQSLITWPSEWKPVEAPFSSLCLHGTFEAYLWRGPGPSIYPVAGGSKIMVIPMFIEHLC